jgi:hypothetical protein
MSLRLRPFLWKHEFLTIARRKERLLSVLGLLIVFLTFLFKEGLREHEKDLLSALQDGQNYFAIHDDIHNIAYRLKDIETELTRILPPPNAQLYPWMKNPTVLEGLHNESTLLDIGASLTNLERLAKTLSNKNESKSVADMRTEFQTLKSGI